MVGDELLGVTEMAVMLHVSETDVRTLAADGDLTPAAPGRLEFHAGDVRRCARELAFRHRMFIEFLHAGEDLHID